MVWERMLVEKEERSGKNKEERTIKEAGNKEGTNKAKSRHLIYILDDKTK